MDDLNAMLDGLNTDYLQEAADNILAVQDAIDNEEISDVEISDTQYITAAAGMVFAAADAAGGLDNLDFENMTDTDPGYDELQDALSLVAEVGDSTDLADMMSLFGTS